MTVRPKSSQQTFDHMRRLIHEIKNRAVARDDTDTSGDAELLEALLLRFVEDLIVEDSIDNMLVLQLKFSQSSRQHQRLGNRTIDFSTLQLFLGRSYSLLFNPQFQSFKLLLGHALQSHRCGQIQSGNVFHFVAGCYLATEFLYFSVSAHFQKHFIRIGDGQSLFNQAMLN
jgi:hypothetical protein